MEGFVPGVIYDNLVKLMEYRGAKITHNLKTQPQVAEELNKRGYIEIKGRREYNEDDPRGMSDIKIVLIAPQSKYSSRSADFESLLKYEGTDPLNLIMVSNHDLSSHIKKKIDSYNKDPNLYVENHTYDIFKIETPKHNSVPKHRLMSNAETEKLCHEMYTTKASFPRIVHTDPQAVWLGLRPGMVVEIERYSENSGLAYVYRTCVKGQI